MTFLRESRLGILAMSLALVLGACERADSDDESAATGDQVTPTGPVVINEVVAKAADGGADWVELYNRGESDVSLDGYGLQDDKDDNLFLFPQGLTISPGEFLIVEGKNSTEELFFSFGLGSDEAVRLLDGEGAIVDMLDWEDGEAPVGQSYGRYPDGGTDVGTLEFATYGAANGPFEPIGTE